ncbi:uncharacterized protein EAF02_010180 [Botrytis sinoallii]|uniref:uncharacterized protein n=1 Tax=Botrytis sinoallii TaxID=1463999 RepID=UPI0019026EA4|nr:uncharacterized protein EAF02_010180 [Botrytis sinoallii]KAF7864212.1 hypothetical protein EAF02_010180 [Botrytis sinoallii]
MASSDDSSDLSSVPSEDESLQLTKKDGILKFFSKAPKPTAARKIETSPPRPKRDPSPPHEYVLADNPDIAFIVMFRARFSEVFPKSLPNFGPQELEHAVVGTTPGEHAEQFLCALLGLLLNRKQDVKAGHYNRALEEAVQTHKLQWAKDWESKNPLSGGATFTSMSPTERLTLLRTLILWSLASSDVVKGMITASYKQTRHEDDLNQPLSVQPWGSDADRRRYYLVEGLDDTHFRVYRESNYTGLKRTWWSVASDIDELKLLAEKLVKDDGGQKARTLSGKMLAAVPRFEATEEKRKRREYRQARKEQFKRPEPNFSMYEGRTRGKRMKYTYSDDEDEVFSDTTGSRRSTRNTGSHTPAEPAGPTVTLSGRQVRSRVGGVYGESIIGGTHAAADSRGDVELGEESEEVTSRPRRAGASSRGRDWASKGKHIEGYNSLDEMDDDEEEDASEQDYGDDEEDDDQVSLASDIEEIEEEPAEETDGIEQMEDDEDEKKSLIVKLPVKTPTPEQKTTIKLHLSPQSKSNSDSVAPRQDPSPPTSTEVTSEGKAISTEADKKIKPISITTKPIQTQLSPTLTFRGSPEKASTLPPSINVGYGGS